MGHLCRHPARAAAIRELHGAKRQVNFDGVHIPKIVIHTEIRINRGGFCVRMNTHDISDIAGHEDHAIIGRADLSLLAQVQGQRRAHVRNTCATPLAEELGHQVAVIEVGIHVPRQQRIPEYLLRHSRNPVSDAEQYIGAVDIADDRAARQSRRIEPAGAVLVVVRGLDQGRRTIAKARASLENATMTVTSSSGHQRHRKSGSGGSRIFATDRPWVVSNEASALVPWP